MTSKLGIPIRRTTNSLEYAANRSTSRCRLSLTLRAQHGEISFAASANGTRADSAAGVRHDLSRRGRHIDHVGVAIMPALAFNYARGSRKGLTGMRSDAAVARDGDRPNGHSGSQNSR